MSSVLVLAVPRGSRSLEDSVRYGRKERDGRVSIVYLVYDRQYLMVSSVGACTLWDNGVYSTAI